ncbi:hypothetical protein [Arthrobacter sp. YAF16]|uniref:hypothetical protein n=1 Tax=Arthrobacter sp. YAF16 TaxID=3233076 RepID=UPI003F921618
MTDPEVKEMLDEVGRRSDAQFAADAARYERDKERYDPEREQARLSLLEQESILGRQREEMVNLRAGRYPAVGEERRVIAREIWAADE